MTLFHGTTFLQAYRGLNEVPVMLKDRIQEFIVTQSQAQPFNVPWQVPFKVSAMIWRHIPYMDVALLFLEFEQQGIHIWIHGVVNIRVVRNDELHSIP